MTLRFGFCVTNEAHVDYSMQKILSIEPFLVRFFRSNFIYQMGHQNSGSWNTQNIYHVQIILLLPPWNRFSNLIIVWAT